MPPKRSSSSSSSSDSEDDAILKQLQECVVSFEAVNSKKLEPGKIAAKSKRNQQNDGSDQEASFVSVEFQEFVSKKLRAKLDE